MCQYTWFFKLKNLELKKLENYMHWHTWVFKLKNPKLKTTWKPICASIHGFSSSEIQSWRDLENHICQCTWVFKLENPKKKAWKPYALTHIVFEAWKSKGEESFKTICVYGHGFSSLENLCALVHNPYENNHRKKERKKERKQNLPSFKQFLPRPRPLKGHIGQI
jgi:hypothetical protein